MTGVQVIGVTGLPELRPGDDLAALIAQQAALEDGDVVVVAQKVVSKVEGALALPRSGEERHAARRRLAREQARRVVAEAPWALIVETRHGFVCANAGIDASNAPGDTLVLLPEDPDASARRLRDALRHRAGAHVAVIVSDTFGRPWRLGQTDVAIGVAGFAPIRDERGGRDRDGRLLEVTETAVADELAAAADLVRGKADGIPVVIVRGFAWRPDETAGGRDLIRPSELDLFARGRGGLTAALGGEDAEDALAMALAAARRVAGDGTRWAIRHDRDTTWFEADHATVRAGVAAGVLVAALTDLGYTARLAGDDPPTIEAR